MDHWDSQSKKVCKGDKKANSLNQNLEIIRRKAGDAFDELKYSGNGFTIDELVDNIKGKENKPMLLIDFLEEGNKKVLKRVGTEILPVTYLKYKRSLRYMKDFLQTEFRVKNFSLQKVNLEFMERYFQYLLKEKKIAHNTACKYLVCVKTIFSPAVRNGLIKPDPFQGLKINRNRFIKNF